MNSDRLHLPPGADRRIVAPAPSLLVPQHIAQEREEQAKQAKVISPKEQYARAQTERAALGGHRRAQALKILARRIARRRRRREVRAENRVAQAFFDLKTMKKGQRIKPHRPPQPAIADRITKQLAWNDDSRSWTWTAMSGTVNPTPYSGSPRRQRRREARAARKRLEALERRARQLQAAA